MMTQDEIKEVVKKKHFLVGSFLYTASLPCGDAPEQVLKHYVTGHFLQAVVLELIIKLLYELDLNKNAPFTHNIMNLFNELKQETKDLLELRFDEARNRRRKQFQGIKDVKFHPLQDVLINNEMTIKNFKYDAMGVHSNSSADGIFYNEVFKYIDKKVKELNKVT